MLLDITEIHIGERMRKEHPDIPKMAHSLLENGQIHAITVRPADAQEIASGVTKPWVLVTGGRRLAGAIFAGWTQIRVENLDHLSSYRRQAIELEENLQRAAMSWQEEVDAKQKLSDLYRQENPDWGDYNTAQAINSSKQQLSRDLRLARAMDENPELKLSSSKNAAHRLLDTKEKMTRKIARLAAVDFDSLEDRLVHTDAVSFLMSLPDDSVDLFLSDLPFGIDYFDMPSNDRKAGGGHSKFDDSAVTSIKLIQDIVPLMLRKAKPSGWLILMTSYELAYAVANSVVAAKVHKLIGEGKKPVMAARPWIWYRPNSRSSPIHPHLNAKSVYDAIYVVNVGDGQLYKACDNVINIDSVYEDRLHAHQKPVPLGVELISRCTQPGDLVIDVTMGSGAFLGAAASIQRKFAGCDLNEDMVPIARSFVAQYIVGSLAPLQITAATPTQEKSMLAAPEVTEFDDVYGRESDFILPPPFSVFATADEEEGAEELEEDDDEDEDEDDDEDSLDNVDDFEDDDNSDEDAF